MNAKMYINVPNYVNTNLNLILTHRLSAQVTVTVYYLYRY